MAYNSAAKSLVAGLDCLRQFAGHPFIFNGATVTALQSKIQPDYAQTEYGVIDGNAFTLRVPLDEITTAPKKGDLIQLPDMGTQNYRVLNNPEKDSVGATLLIDVGASQR